MIAGMMSLFLSKVKEIGKVKEMKHFSPSRVGCLQLLGFTRTFRLASEV